LGLELTWLGQAGFLIEADGLRVLIDPFLSDYEARLYPPPGTEELATDIDWLLVTHEHLDHLDTGFLPTLVDRSPSVRLVIPEPITPQVDGLISQERIVAVQPGSRVELRSEVHLDVVPAFHGVEVQDGYGDGSQIDGLVRFVGYVVRGSTLSIYHSGDTIIHDELLAALEGSMVDVALLPINGRDYFREEAGLVGNMDVREAVRLATRIGATVLIPMHWDLFAGNTERPSAVLDETVETGAPFHVLTLARFRPYKLA
jgi:L-ascorbate metabolism protein UlaG (beta-lactamase superfamily)